MNSEGKEVILVVIGPRELFGELALTEEEEPRSEIAEALDEVLICTIKRDDLESLLRMNPELTLQITKRIATFLVRYAEEFGKVKHDVVSIRTYLTHQEIAFLTGSARQTVTSTLDEFRKQGILEFSRVGFLIKDLDRLRALSRAVFAGLVGTAVMTAVALMGPIMGMPEMKTGEMLAGFVGIPVLMGWVAHFMIGSVLSIIYATVFSSTLPGAPWLKGAIYGLLP